MSKAAFLLLSTSILLGQFNPYLHPFPVAPPTGRDGGAGAPVAPGGASDGGVGEPIHDMPDGGLPPEPMHDVPDAGPVGSPSNNGNAMWSSPDGKSAGSPTNNGNTGVFR